MHTTVIAGSSRQQPVCPGPPPLIAPAINLPSANPGKRNRKNYVDPCVIAPLKKRRIQVKERLKENEGERVRCGYKLHNISQPTSLNSKPGVSILAS